MLCKIGVYILYIIYFLSFSFSFSLCDELPKVCWTGSKRDGAFGFMFLYFRRLLLPALLWPVHDGWNLLGQRCERSTGDATGTIKLAGTTLGLQTQ